MPTAPLALGSLLPVFRSMAEAIVGRAVETVTAEGKSISCQSGCGACCRQLVPVSEPEARLLAALVAALPEPRRSVIRARFANALARLEAAGVAERLRHPESFADDALRPVGLDYFRVGAPCPFLEAESCSIYEERPIACREYLVTSPAAHCAAPTAETIRCVPLPAKVSNAVTRLGIAPGSRFVRWVPLILVLEWAETHPDDLPPRPGPRWLDEFFEKLTGRDLPSPPPSGPVGD